MTKSHDPKSAFQLRKQRRIRRWARPIETTRHRLRAWANMLFVDHGVFRLFYANLHPVGQRAWRSAQPTPAVVRRFAEKGGRSVVSLRGGQAFGSLPLTREACEAHGLRYHNFVLRSRMLPTRAELLEAADLFDRLEYPVLFHCKSGADRAGFMSGLYLMLAEGRPVAEARAQLSLRFGHIRQGKTGVLDAFFEAYETETGSRLPLREWIATRYNRDRVTAQARSTGWGRLLSDHLLRRE